MKNETSFDFLYFQSGRRDGRAMPVAPAVLAQRENYKRERTRLSEKKATMAT
jgi:hypothetical protein